MQLGLRTIKDGVRKDIAKKLKSINPEDRSSRSAKITERFLQSDVYRNSRAISLFVSLPSEVSTRPIFEDIFQSHKICYIPKVTLNGEMQMLQIYSLEDLDSLPRVFLPQYIQ
eukprot:TRINITY_DN4922_c0_g1_i1.p1 TRINITY_DN4922_c0_g1~~TRINITY_DN4922_c0_g1_i1.p1  ORF type:complete len:113 (+),score=14.27 TRINITY_DN4922_c0_g1_i1:1-339(+)